jgi:hypothetical protein
MQPASPTRWTSHHSPLGNGTPAATLLCERGWWAAVADAAGWRAAHYSVPASWTEQRDAPEHHWHHSGGGCVARVPHADAMGEALDGTFKAEQCKGRGGTPTRLSGRASSGSPGTTKSVSTPRSTTYRLSSTKRLLVKRGAPPAVRLKQVRRTLLRNPGQLMVLGEGLPASFEVVDVFADVVRDGVQRWCIAAFPVLGPDGVEPEGQKVAA